MSIVTFHMSYCYTDEYLFILAYMRKCDVELSPVASPMNILSFMYATPARTLRRKSNCFYPNNGMDNTTHRSLLYIVGAAPSTFLRYLYPTVFTAYNLVYSPTDALRLPILALEVPPLLATLSPCRSPRPHSKSDRAYKLFQHGLLGIH